MTTAAAIKDNIQLHLAYSFRGLFHYCHRGKDGSIQAGMVLVTELRVLCLDPQLARRDYVPYWVWLEHRRLKAHPTVTYSLQQGHTDSNKATPPYGPKGHTDSNKATPPYGPSIHTHESLGCSYSSHHVHCDGQSFIDSYVNL